MVIKPKVSVVIPTYNQDKYISQTIKSVLRQNTKFPFEILIGEDCSTDNTKKICQKYFQKYPDIIRLINNKTNLGLLKNFSNLLKISKGKYIAILGGDDYWIDKYKLQKQIDFLDKNTDFSLIFTNAKRYSEEKQLFIKNFYKNKKQDIYSCEDLILYNFIPALTTVFRKEPNFSFPKNWNKYYPEDWTLFILLSQNKKIKYMSRVTSVYRITQNGLGSGISFLKRLQKTTPTLKMLKKELNPKYQNLIQQTIIDYIFYTAIFALINLDLKEFKNKIKEYKNEKQNNLIKELINTFLRTIKRFLLKRN